jgi:hypothetical protein
MARQLVEKYIFTPGVANVGNLKIPGKIELNQLLIIANKTTQENIYALGDVTRNATLSYDATDTTTFYSPEDGVTTIVFARDTSAMSSAHKIAVYTDAPKNVGNIIRPYAFGVDAIERQRVATPQALIDADFEYGLQPTKWQNYTDIRNIPGIFEKPGLDLPITAITTDGATPSLITITTSTNHGLSAGDPIIVYGLGNISTYARAEGAFICASASGTTITYYAKGTIGTNGQSLFTGSTYGRKAGFFAGANLPVASFTSNAASPSVITVTTTNNHGLVPGATLICVATSVGTNHALMTGTVYAETVPSANTFTFTARAGGAVANASITANIYTRSDAFVLHRPFDGGVQLGTFNPSHGASVSRQTKKYMRYQSGKGLLWTSGVLFNPVMNLDQISASSTSIGATITVTTETDHGLQAGVSVLISGVVTSGYNGTYTVNAVTSENTFTYLATSAPAVTNAVITNLPRVTIKNWHGSSVRVGPFDDQNGLYWEFDGQELSVGKRSGTYQLSGNIAVNAASQAVTGTSTRFTQQLKSGDRIVIRGMTYMVNSIASDTSLTINPEFRGVNNVSGVKISSVLEQRIPQSQFNVDKIDGTGFSGYNINLNKMQMLGISSSWYGAGFIDFMCRGVDGNMVLVHRMKQNNINDEAYMRTGNAAVRYQAINESARDRLAVAMDASQTTMTLADASRFPTASASYPAAVMCEGEIITYTGKSGNVLTGLTRGASITQFSGGQTRSFTGTAAFTHALGNGYNSVTLVSCTAAPVINHWGSSYIMDGGYDQDRGYYFNYPKVNITLTSAQSVTAFFVRLAPSVSNSVVGTLGDRELINRSQLLLQKLQVQSDQSVQITGILNPGNVDASSLTWQSLNVTANGSQPSFAQISVSSATAATPGEQIFGTLAAPGSLNEIDLTALKELTNSAIGGYSNYPDGPDNLAIVVTNLTASNARVSVNLFWSEAQA